MLSLSSTSFLSFVYYHQCYHYHQHHFHHLFIVVNIIIIINIIFVTLFILQPLHHFSSHYGGIFVLPVPFFFFIDIAGLTVVLIQRVCH